MKRQRKTSKIQEAPKPTAVVVMETAWQKFKEACGEAEEQGFGIAIYNEAEDGSVEGVSIVVSEEPPQPKVKRWEL